MCEIGNINNITDLINCVDKYDRNYDYRISLRENEEMVAKYDRDESKTVELWELMGAVNKQRQREIFSDRDISRYKLVYEYLEDKDIEEKSRIGSPGVQFSILEEASQLDLSFDEIKNLAHFSKITKVIRNTSATLALSGFLFNSLFRMIRGGAYDYFLYKSPNACHIFNFSDIALYSAVFGVISYLILESLNLGLRLIKRSIN